MLDDGCRRKRASQQQLDLTGNHPETGKAEKKKRQKKEMPAPVAAMQQRRLGVTGEAVCHPSSFGHSVGKTPPCEAALPVSDPKRVWERARGSSGPGHFGPFGER